MVCLLSDEGADRMQGGATPLFIASQSGNLDVVCLLSVAGADKDIADQSDAAPLLVASENGQTTSRCPPAL